METSKDQNADNVKDLHITLSLPDKCLNCKFNRKVCIDVPCLDDDWEDGYFKKEE